MLDQHCISLTFKRQSIAVVLPGPPGVAEMVLWNSVSILPFCFLGIRSLSFSEFWHGARNLFHVVHDRVKFFEKKKKKKKKKKKIWKLAKNRVVWNLNKYLAIIFTGWICSVMKIYIICCLPAQILYLGKSCFWDIGQNGLSKSHSRIFRSTISPEQISETV